MASDSAGCGRLMIGAGVILATTSAALAHHDGTDDDADFGTGIPIGGVLPFVVAVVVVMAGLGLWGRKQPQTKAGRRKRKR